MDGFGTSPVFKPETIGKLVGGVPHPFGAGVVAAVCEFGGVSASVADRAVGGAALTALVV